MLLREIPDCRIWGREVQEHLMSESKKGSKMDEDVSKTHRSPLEEFPKAKFGTI